MLYDHDQRCRQMLQKGGLACHRATGFMDIVRGAPTVNRFAEKRDLYLANAATPTLEIDGATA